MLRNILIVDDSPVMRRIMIQTLKDCGFNILPIEATNGKDALSKFSLRGVHMVMSDWNMPVMDGLEMVKELRKIDPTNLVPIVMFTTQANQNKVVEALKTGIQDYIVKPYTVEVVKAKLSKYFEGDI